MKLRKVLRIARWEVTKNAGGVDRKTLVVAGIAIVAAGLVAPTAATQGIALDSGIYRVGVASENPYHEVVANDSTFTVREPDRAALDSGRIDLLIQGNDVEAAPTQKGEAAKEELRSTVKEYNDAQMGQESNQSAAFPVAVTLRYSEREDVQEFFAPGQSQGTSDGETLDEDERTESTGDSDSGDGDGTDSGGDGGSDADSGDTDTGGGTGGDLSDGGGSGAPGGAGGLAGSLGSSDTSGAPSDIAPPFPFQSLVLAFLFVIPMNFIIQAYGSTMLSERLNRRGELLLVSPVTRFDIIGGKTLPYLAGALGIVSVIATAVQAPAVSLTSIGTAVVAMAPIALLFLGATFVGAMFARSFKELTFVTVTITVSLTTYAFVPAIFTDVGPIALISPLTIIVRDLQGQSVTLGQFTFSTLPPLLSASVLFMLGAGIYREEDMFTQRSIPLKLLDSLAARVYGKWSVAAVSALLLPFVFVAELLGIAMLFAIPEALSVPTILVIVAIVEELAKSLHVYAGYAHRRFEQGITTAVIVGAFAGFGFFVGEKLTLVAQLVGLPERIVEGQAALGSTGTGLPSIPLVVAFLFAPLVLHAVTAAISAIGASRGRQSYGVALSIAIVVHFLYNLTVVNLSGTI